MSNLSENQKNDEILNKPEVIVEYDNSETIYPSDLILYLDKLWGLKGKSLCLNLNNRDVRWKITSKNIRDAGFPNVERVSSTWYKNNESFNKDIKYVFNRINLITGSSFDISKLIFNEGEPIVELTGENKSITLRNAALACKITHLKIWLNLLDSDYDYYVYFEDDIEFLKNFAQNFMNIMNIENSLEAEGKIPVWDAFFQDTFYLNRNAKPNIIKSISSFDYPEHNIKLEKLIDKFANAHFVIIKKINIVKMIKGLFPFNGNQIDVLIYNCVEKFNLNFYSVTGICKQNAFCSDIQNKIPLEDYQKYFRNVLLSQLKVNFPNINSESFIQKYIDKEIFEEDFNPQDFEYNVKDELKYLKTTVVDYLFCRRRGLKFNEGTSNYLLNLLEMLNDIETTNKNKRNVNIVTKIKNQITKINNYVIKNKHTIEKTTRMALGLSIIFYTVIYKSL
jgi:GR25 family glycosyltransferase involved in LPS biosynthesis